MKPMKALCIVLGLVAFSVSAYAADETTPTWEFSGAANASFTHDWIDQNPDTNQYKIATTADYFVMPALELGLDVSMDFVSSAGTTNSVNSFLAGPTFNFGGAPINSFFVTARAGITLFDEGDTLSMFTWEVLFGKRFQLGSLVSWAPEIGVIGVSSATDDNTGESSPTTTGLVITPFRFSILF